MGTSNSKSDPSGPISEYNPNLEAIQVTDDPNYGRIKLVRETKTHHQMILKEFMFDTKQACEEELRFFKERASFGHPNMVQIIGYNSSQNKNLCSNLFKVSVFIEILPKELDTVLKERARKKADYSENEILVLAGNVISALYHLQTKNMAHGDIRPLNIFVQGNTYKVTDPKLETDKNANALSKAIINKSHTLLSPELLANVPNQKFEFTEDPFKADVFSLGATLLHAATLKSSEELYDYQNGRLDQRRLAERLEEVRAKYSPFIYQLISNMLRLNGKERPDFADLRNILLPYQEVIQHQGDLPYLSSHQETFGGSAAVRRQGGERVKSSVNTNQTRRVQFSEGQMSSENDNLDDMVREALRKSEDVIRQAQAETGVSRQPNFGGEIRNNEIPKKSQNIGRNVNAPPQTGFEQNDTEIDALDAKIKNAIQNSQNVFKQTQGVDLGGQVKSFNQQSNAVNFTQKNIEGDRRNQEIAKKSQNVARNVNAPPQIGFQQDLNVNRKVEVRETKEDALREPVQLFQEYRREREEERPINQIQEERLRKSQQMQNIQPAGVNYQLPNVTPGPGLGGYATQNQQDIQRQVYSQTFGQPTNFGYESGFRQNVPQQTSTTTYEATQSYQPINIEGLLSNYNAPSTNISQHHVRNVTGEHAVRSSPRVTASDDVRIGQIAGNSTISTNPFNYTSTTSTTGEAFQTTYGQHDFGVQQYRTGGPLPVNPETERILKLYHDVDTTQRISTPLHQGGGFGDVYTTTYGQNDFGAQQYQIGGIGSTQEHHFISNTGHIDTGVGVTVPLHSQTEKVLKAYRQVDTSPRAQGVTVSSFQQTGALGDNFKTTYGQHDFGTQQYQSGIGMSLPVNPETEKILKAYSHTLERRQVPDIQTGEFGRTDAVIYYENQIKSGPGGFAEVQFEHRQ